MYYKDGWQIQLGKSYFVNYAYLFNQYPNWPELSRSQTGIVSPTFPNLNIQ